MMNLVPSRISSFFVLFVLAWLLPAAAPAQDVALETEELDVEAAIDDVTVYLGRASITRRATLKLDTGLYEIHFPDLPPTVLPDSLQARASGDVKVVSVDFELRQVAAAPSQEIAELDATLEELRRTLEELRQQRGLIASQEETLNALGFRMAEDATSKSGTSELDLEAVQQQLEFLAAERERLLKDRQQLDRREKELQEELRLAEAERNAIGGASRESRRAIVTAAASTSGEVELELIYLVTDASWHPSYNIRAASDLTGASVEYNAVLLQRTGEDWDNVKLTLSTAQPRLAGNPPTLDPWFVDIEQPRAAGLPAIAAEHAPAPRSPEADRARADADARSKAVEEWSRDAMVTGSGPAVAFEVPRPVSVASNAEKQQRTRIGSFSADVEFVYVAVPVHTDAVYLRGDLTNSSTYQLLSGPVAIFLGQDYIGQTQMTAVAPQGEFDVHFGIDPAISAERLLVEKNTSSTGLLGGGRETTYAYRLSIDNGTGKQITVEIWDRVPASRTDQISVDIVDLSTTLATDREYVQEDRPRGLLKWLVNIPAGATGSKAAQITYGVEINRGKNVDMTPLPE